MSPNIYDAYMTYTFDLGTPLLSTVFSFPVWDTHMHLSVLAKEYFKNVFVTMADKSANPNSEWSVNTVPRPSRLPTNKASCARAENAACP